jgi:hypothetical protein
VDIWLSGDPEVRDFIYTGAEEFVARTGWYPRAHGERLKPVRLDAIRRRARVALKEARVAAPLLSIESAVGGGADGGVGLRVRTAGGSILLDSGSPAQLTVLDSDNVLLLSHAHLDHAGCLPDVVDAGLTIAMSAVTQHLCIQWKRLRRGQRNVRVVGGSMGWYELGGGISLRAFPVPHMPGSLGFQLTDGERSLVYTGDVCLRTRRHDFLDDLVDLVTGVPGSSRTVVLDGTMIGGKAGASKRDAARAIFDHAEGTGDLVVVSDYDEQALYCYLDLYFTQSRDPSLRGHFSFLCSPGVRGLMEALRGASTRVRGTLDPFLAMQYRGNANLDLWGESTLLYWTDTMKSLPTSSSRIWISARADISEVKPPPGKVLLAQIGRRTPLETAYLERVSRLDIDTSPWTVHSDREAIFDAVDRLYEAGARVLVFHAPKKAVAKELRIENGARLENGLADLSVEGLSTTPVPL